MDMNDMYTLTLELNAKLAPLDRGYIYEDPIAEALEAAGCGTTDGGGTLLKESGEVALCDVVICLNDNTEESMNSLIRVIDDIKVPKGSFLIGEDIKIPVGCLEGLGLYLNGTELPDDVYKTCDINYIVKKCNELMAPDGMMYSHWRGPQNTALYFYGSSFEKMKEKIAGFLEEYPLCQKCKVEQVA